MQREFIFTDRWLDLLFENRNRSYGAYVLRKRQPDNVLIGWVTAVVFFGIAIFTGYELNKISTENMRTLIDKIKHDKDVIIETISYQVTIPTKIEISHVSAPSHNNVTSLAKAVVVDEILITEVKTDANTNVTNPPADVGNAENKDMGDNGTTGTTPFTNYTSTEPISIPAKMPEFPGGENAIIKFLQTNTHYPPKYLKDMINGTVWISFVVNAEGYVTDIEVKHGIEGHPEFSDAAVESISKMPRWTPGQQNEMNVPVLFTVPVKFSVR